MKVVSLGDVQKAMYALEEGSRGAKDLGKLLTIIGCRAEDQVSSVRNQICVLKAGLFSEDFLFYHTGNDIMIVGTVGRTNLRVDESACAPREIGEDEVIVAIRIYYTFKVPCWDMVLVKRYPIFLDGLTTSHFDKWNPNETRPVAKIREELDELNADIARLSTAQGQEALMYARHALYELADVIWVTMGYTRRILNRWTGEKEIHSDRVVRTMLDKWVADETHPYRAPLLLAELWNSEVDINRRFQGQSYKPTYDQRDSFSDLASDMSADQCLYVFDMHGVPWTTYREILEYISPTMSFWYQDHCLVIKCEREDFAHYEWAAILMHWTQKIYGNAKEYFHAEDNLGFDTFISGEFHTEFFGDTEFDKGLMEANKHRTEKCLADNDLAKSCCSEDLDNVIDYAMRYFDAHKFIPDVHWKVVDSSVQETVTDLEAYFADRTYDVSTSFDVKPNAKQKFIQFSYNGALFQIHLMRGAKYGMPSTKLLLFMLKPKQR